MKGLHASIVVTLRYRAGLSSRFHFIDLSFHTWDNYERIYPDIHTSTHLYTHTHTQIYTQSLFGLYNIYI